MSYTDPFFLVPRTTHDTSEGPVELPILYGDTSAAYAFFLIDAGPAWDALSGTGLQLASAAGKALVGVACFEYRDTTVGVYNEVGIAVPVTPEGYGVALAGLPDLLRTRSHPEERRVGFHILHLPVTTAAANAAGRELWGYPKFVTPIDVAVHRDPFVCRVHDPDGVEPIMDLRGRMGPGLPVPGLSLLTYSVLDGDVVRTTVNARGRTRAHRGGGLRLRVGDSRHAMAATLRAFGLDGASPVAVLTTPKFQSRLNGGVVVGTSGRAATSEQPPDSAELSGAAFVG